MSNSSLLSFSTGNKYTTFISNASVISDSTRTTQTSLRKFTEQDFLDGKVGEKLVPEDFDFEENVSYVL